VVQAILEAHPYEEAPVEVHRLEPMRDPHQGHGRIVQLDKALSTTEVAQRLRKGLRLPVGSMQLVESKRAQRHQRIGVVPGAGFSMMAKAADQGCTLFVTGEARHHDQLAAKARGCDLLLGGHSQTERGYLPTLAASLKPHLPGVSLVVSRADAPPFRMA
jgi:putative NIF3 family GTP cyclohydrolase 1 type 2